MVSEVATIDIGTLFLAGHCSNTLLLEKQNWQEGY